jgi:hypothetical protein
MITPQGPTARPENEITPERDHAPGLRKAAQGSTPAALARGDSEPLCAVQAWETLEVLSPQTFKESDDVARSVGGNVVKITGGPLPWELPPTPGSKPEGASYHVLFGSIDMAKATADPPRLWWTLGMR